MQIKNIITVSKFAFMAALAVGILFAGKADAQTTTYFVDPTGNGCNASCQQQIAEYFMTTGNVTNGPSNGTSTGTSTATSTTSSTTTTTTTGGGSNYNGYGYNASMYPYLTYQYTRPSAPKSDTFNYVQYPYMTYKYNTPAPTNNTMSQYVQYPMLAYVYYDKDANAQIEKFKQAQGISNAYTAAANSQNYAQAQGYNNYGAYGNSNSGFTMTSGYGY